MSRLHVTNEYVLELNNVYHAGQVIYSLNIYSIVISYFIDYLFFFMCIDGSIDMSGKNGGKQLGWRRTQRRLIGSPWRGINGCSRVQRYD